MYPHPPLLAPCATSSSRASEQGKLSHCCYTHKRFIDEKGGFPQSPAVPDNYNASPSRPKKKKKTQISAHNQSNPPTPSSIPGGWASRSTPLTRPLWWPLSRTRFPKYLRASLLSARTFSVSSRRLPSCSTERWRPTRRESAGKRRTLRTEPAIRVELACT